MKKYLLFVLVSVAMTSCVPSFYQQIAEVKSNSVPMQGKNYVYSDANCKISYDFWDERGNAGFVIENLTNELLYVNMAESFYTNNGIAYDYFKKRTFSKSSVTYRYGYYRPQVTLEKNASAVGQTISYNEKDMLIIPPHSVKKVTDYNIALDLIEDCSVKMYPKNKRKESKDYNESDSPIKFSNYLTYRVGEKGAPVHINNSFYVAGFRNYNVSEVYDSEKFGCKGQFSTRSNKFAAPTKYYINYTAKHTNAYSADAKAFNKYMVR